MVVEVVGECLGCVLVQAAATVVVWGEAPCAESLSGLQHGCKYPA